MSGIYLDGRLYVQVEEKYKEPLLEIDLDKYDLQWNCSIDEEGWAEDEKVPVPKGEVVISIYFSDEIGYSFDESLQPLIRDIYEICGKYPKGYIIEETEGEGTYRVEIDPKTGEIIEDSCSWLSDYPIEVNRKCYECAEKLLEEKEEKKND